VIMMLGIGSKHILVCAKTNISRLHTYDSTGSSDRVANLLPKINCASTSAN